MPEPRCSHPVTSECSGLWEDDIDDDPRCYKLQHEERTPWRTLIVNEMIRLSGIR